MVGGSLQKRFVLPSGLEAFKIKDDLKKVIYGVLRAPEELLELMKRSADLYKWEHGGWNSKVVCCNCTVLKYEQYGVSMSKDP